MSGALDDESRETAFELLEEYGKACTLNRVTAGEYDVETGGSTNTTAAHPINVYMDQPNRQELTNGQVLHTDEVAMFPALGLSIEPLPPDTITVDSKAREIKAVGRVWSGAQVALWRCVLAS